MEFFFYTLIYLIKYYFNSQINFSKYTIRELKKKKTKLKFSVSSIKYLIIYYFLLDTET